MLDLFELARWEHELIESFSHGMKQRLVMSAAFLHRPRAVLVDEPMVGLDPRGARLIKDVFRRMSQHGVAILMSTHTLEVAQEMCDRISIILKGRIIARGTVDELREMAGGGDPNLTVVSSSDGCNRLQRSTRSSDGRLPLPAVAPRLSSDGGGARRRQRGDLLLAALFSAIAFLCSPRFRGIILLTVQLAQYEELGDYLLRLGLSWLFLTFLSFLAFSGVVTALSIFFLSEDLRLLLAAPVAARRLFHARFLRTVGQASWMVVVFLAPVLAGIGAGRARPSPLRGGGPHARPFAVIPVARGPRPLLLVNLFPAAGPATPHLRASSCGQPHLRCVIQRTIMASNRSRSRAFPAIVAVTPIRSPSGRARRCSRACGEDRPLHVAHLDDRSGLALVLRAAKRSMAFRRFQPLPEAEGAADRSTSWIVWCRAPLSSVRRHRCQDLKGFCET